MLPAQTVTGLADLIVDIATEAVAINAPTAGMSAPPVLDPEMIFVPHAVAPKTLSAIHAPGWERSFVLSAVDPAWFRVQPVTDKVTALSPALPAGQRVPFPVTRVVAQALFPQIAQPAQPVEWLPAPPAKV
jgi:hypothetical protein